MFGLCTVVRATWAAPCPPNPSCRQILTLVSRNFRLSAPSVPPVSFFLPLSCLVSVFLELTHWAWLTLNSGHSRLLIMRLDDPLFGRPPLNLLLGLPRPHWLSPPRLWQPRHGFTFLWTAALLTHGLHPRTDGQPGWQPWFFPKSSSSSAVWGATLAKLPPRPLAPPGSGPAGCGHSPARHPT